MKMCEVWKNWGLSSWQPWNVAREMSPLSPHIQALGNHSPQNSEVFDFWPRFLTDPNSLYSTWLWFIGDVFFAVHNWFSSHRWAGICKLCGLITWARAPTAIDLWPSTFPLVSLWSLTSWSVWHLSEMTDFYFWYFPKHWFITFRSRQVILHLSSPWLFSHHRS